MRHVEQANAQAYLRERGWIGADESVRVTTLEGGVSNQVYYVERRDAADFVLKQAREQLRVAEPWFCSVERIWRECDVIKASVALLSDQRPQDGDPNAAELAIPRILFEDRENFCYAMTAAPLGHRPWKSVLLEGRPSEETAAACGRFLAALHRGSWNDKELSCEFADRTFFIELRVDPYYRHVARGADDLRDALTALESSLAENPLCLVHGDFSPKNLLTFDGGLMLIDFEVGHFGDPAFDLGFFLSHLTLKSFWAASRRLTGFSEMIDAFWASYRQGVAPLIGEGPWRLLEQRASANLAGCGMARLDGKSRIDYLADAHPARTLFRRILLTPPENWPETRAWIEQAIARRPKP